jgi:NADH-quinone oxidoreductase E subunit
LTTDLKERASAIIRRYPSGRSRSALLPLLHLAQRRDGHITQAAIQEVAEILGLSTADVTGVATFYHMLHMKPKGRHVISVCHTLACSLAGAEKIITALERSVGVSCGQSSSDGELHLERAECLAHCEIAPMIQIDYDTMIGPVTEGSLAEILDQVRGGQFDASVDEELEHPLEAPLPWDRERRMHEPITDVEGRFAEEVSQARDESIPEPVGRVTQPPSYEDEQIVITQGQPAKQNIVPEPLYSEEPLWVETIQLSQDEEDLLKSPEERRGHRKPPAPDRLYEMPDEGPGPGPAPPDEELKEALEAGEEEEEEEPPVRPRGAED